MKVVAVWIGGITALVEGSTQPIAWAARVDGFASGSLMPGRLLRPRPCRKRNVAPPSA